MENFMRSLFLKQIQTFKKSKPEKLLKFISAIEYIEGIFEITARKLFGEKFKWLIIFIAQAAKCLLRLCLLLFHKISIQPSPKLFSFKSLTNNDSQSKNTDEISSFGSSSSNTFKLKHSDRVIRSVNDAPDLNNRDWKLNENENNREDFDVTKESHYLIAELFYIVRPITHLTILYVFNSKSWMQFMIPFVMDSTSLLIMNKSKKLSAKQKEEIKRRSYTYLSYLLRSPVYDTCTKSIIDVIINIFEQKLPGGHIIMKPFKNYIPEWRTVYAYLWSS